MRAILFALVLLALMVTTSPAGQRKRLTVSSAAFADQADIPTEYTCDGEEESPPLRWSKVPDGTRSIAILVDDPDAPQGNFTHWVITGLPPTTRHIDAGALPKGAIEGTNGAGKTGWVGPCPPKGKHHYVFRVFALDTALSKVLDRTELKEAIDGHILASGKLVGLYRKQR